MTRLLILKNLIIIFTLATSMQASGIGSVLEQMKAKEENRIVEKDDTRIIYCDTKHKKQKQTKVYNKHKQKVLYIEYSCDTGYKTDEYEYVYDSNDNKRYSSYIYKQYHSNGKLKSKSTYKVVKRRPCMIESTQYYNSGKLYSRYISKLAENKKDYTLTYYDTYGKVSYSEHYNQAQKEVKEYEYDALVREGIYKPIKSEDIPLDFVVLYRQNGDIKSEKFYNNGSYVSKSLCSFKTIKYIKKLEKQYSKKIKNLKRQNNQCLRLGKTGKYVMIIPYSNYKKDNTQIIISLIDEKNKKIKSSLYSKDTTFNHISLRNKIVRTSYLSLIDKKVFDILSVEETNSGDTLKHIKSYKILKNSQIKKLKTPTFNLDNIIKKAKNGKKISSALIFAMTNELPIDKQNAKQYEQLALYLQKYNFHTQALDIFLKIIQKFPKRAKTFLYSAKSWAQVEGELAALDAYQNYANLLKTQKKPIEKWVTDIIKKGKHDYLKSLNINHKIVKIDNKLSQVIFTTSDNLTIRVNFPNNIKVKKRIIFKDIDFDGRLEVLIDVSSDQNIQEYKIFKVEYGFIKAYLFNRKKTIQRFILNKRDETLIEFTNKTVDTYCHDSRDGHYYLCKQEKN